jgi:hypothetical protein
VVGPIEGLTLGDVDGRGVDGDGSDAVLADELVCLTGDEWPAVGELLGLTEGCPVWTPVATKDVAADETEAADADWAATCCLSP